MRADVKRERGRKEQGRGKMERREPVGWRGRGESGDIFIYN